MGFIRNILALVGLVVVAGLVTAGIMFSEHLNQIRALDRQAGEVYLKMADALLKTGNAAEATVWKMRVNDDLKPKDVDEIMKFVANEHNIKNVGELPLYQQVEAMTGKPYRFVKIYMFCNAVTATKMLDFSDAYSAYLPCRISLIEDQQGKLWLYSLNMDMMIHGGKPLPPELKAEAINVKKIILDIMNRGAKGEF